jgi:hypothetical protein
MVNEAGPEFFPKAALIFPLGIAELVAISKTLPW